MAATDYGTRQRRSRGVRNEDLDSKGENDRDGIASIS